MSECFMGNTVHQKNRIDRTWGASRVVARVLGVVARVLLCGC